MNDLNQVHVEEVCGGGNEGVDVGCAIAATAAAIGLATAATGIGAVVAGMSAFGVGLACAGNQAGSTTPAFETSSDWSYCNGA
jgi:hypothetical protein